MKSLRFLAITSAFLWQIKYLLTNCKKYISSLGMVLAIRSTFYVINAVAAVATQMLSNLTAHARSSLFVWHSGLSMYL